MLIGLCFTTTSLLQAMEFLNKHVYRRENAEWQMAHKDRYVSGLDRLGLYTFMIIAEDLRGIKWKPMSSWGDARVGKCRIMEYTVAK
jgi:hypothetical protein